MEAFPRLISLIGETMLKYRETAEKNPHIYARRVARTIILINE